jgi:hypothetical protein
MIECFPRPIGVAEVRNQQCVRVHHHPLSRRRHHSNAASQLPDLSGLKNCRQGSDHFLNLCIDYLNRIVIAECDDDELTILAGRDSARPRPDFDGINQFHLVGVDDADPIAFSIRDESEIGVSGNRRRCLENTE